jgi:hypothetical protein
MGMYIEYSRKSIEPNDFPGMRNGITVMATIAHMLEVHTGQAVQRT